MLKRLRERLRKAMAKIKATKGKVEDAQKNENEEEIESATKAFESAVAESKEVSAELEKAIGEAKEHKRMEGLLKDSETLTKAVPPAGIDLSGQGDDDEPGGEPSFGKKLAAEALDHHRKELEKEHLFFEFLQKGANRMSGTAIDALQPKNKDLSKDSTEPVATIPRNTMNKIFPGLFKKALPMTSHDNDAQGGRANLIYPDYGTEILQLPTEEPSLFLRATKKTTVGGSLVETRLKQDDNNEFGGVAVSWVDEETDAPDTEAELERITINCHPLKAYTSLTKVLLSRDRWNFESELVDKLRKAMIAAFDVTIMNGSGVKQPLGIRVMDGIRTRARLVNGKVSYKDLVAMKHAVLPHHRTGATWMMDDTVSEHLDGITDTTNRPIFSQSIGSGPLDRMLSYMWFVSTRCTTLGTPGDIVFGNLIHYWFVIEEEIAIARSEHAEFKKGGIAFRVDALAGGRPMFERAFAVLTGVGS